MSDKGPVTFTATNAEAHRDGDVVKLEMHAGANIRMVFNCEPQSALELAHQIERAFHQRERVAAAQPMQSAGVPK